MLSAIGGLLVAVGLVLVPFSPAVFGGVALDSNEHCVEAHADPSSVPDGSRCGGGCEGNPGCSGTVWIQASIGGDCKPTGTGCSLYGGQKEVVLQKYRCEAVTLDCPPGTSRCVWNFLGTVSSWIGNCKNV